MNTQGDNIKKRDYFKIGVLILLAWISYSIFSISLSYSEMSQNGRYNLSEDHSYIFDTRNGKTFLFKGLDIPECINNGVAKKDR